MVAVDLDKTRNLQFGLASIRDLEASLDGRPLASILGDLSRMGMNALVNALYFGLRKEDPSLNLRLIERMVEQRLTDGESLQPLFSAIVKALEETGVFRTNEDVSEGKQKTPTLA